ncbi:MAG: DnaJ domain-containing protein [Euryarchaeota archaeon]|nr:DnaJ domain-containing protein [Euryarchaeota archaeon]
MSDQSEYIDWPSAFPRTPQSEREPYPGNFRVTRSQAFQNILDELATWDGVTDVQLDSGAVHQKQNPNKPYANASFEDPGAVVYFTKEGDQMAAACDRWDNPRDNAQDLFHYLHETRMQEQRGTVTAENEYQKLRLPSGNDAVSTGPPAHETLGVGPDASPVEVKKAWQKRVKETHPDRGGSAEELQRVHDAKEVILDE